MTTPPHNPEHNPASGPQPQHGMGGTPQPNGAQPSGGAQSPGGAQSQQGYPGQPHPQYGPGYHNQGYGSFPGGPKKNRTGLIVGLSLLGVAVVGGIVALILVLTNKEDPDPVAAAPTNSDSSQAPSSAPQKSSNAPLPGGITPGDGVPNDGSIDQVDVEKVAKDFISNVNSKNIAGAMALVCKPTDNERSKFLGNLEALLQKEATLTFSQMQKGRSIGTYYAISNGNIDGKQTELAVGLYAGLNICVLGIVYPEDLQ